METIELRPFSPGEIGDAPDRFVDAAFRHGPALRRTSELRRRDHVERVVRGGFPNARPAFLEAAPDTVRYAGQQALPLGDEVRAVPIEALWRAKL
jgi:hypothetical protein